MIVFKYFYEKMGVFGPLIDQKQLDDDEDNEDESYDEDSGDEQLVHLKIFEETV